MSDEGPETRRRSRSKTPFLRSACDHEHCGEVGHEHHTHSNEKRRKIQEKPTVQTISEEVPTETRTTRTTRTTKIVTSDYSSEDNTSPKASQTTSSVMEMKAPAASSSKTVTTTVTTSIMPESSVKLLRNVDVSVHNISTSISSSGQKEISQNEINNAFENAKSIETSTPIQSAKVSKKTVKKTTSPVNISLHEDIDLSQHIAYKQYTEAGEYWNKYPKTDYTYSKLSPHRRELAPGIIAMPNMSRRSLKNHDARVDEMVRRNKSQESFIRKRYDAIKRAIPPLRPELLYDSADETDYQTSSFMTTSETTTTTTTTQKVSIVRRVLVTIIRTLFFWTRFFSSNQHSQKYTSFSENQSWYSRLFVAIGRGLITVFRPIYAFIASVLFVDHWMLQSSEAGRSKRKLRILLLVLLPILLLAALHYFNPEKDTKFSLPHLTPVSIPLTLSAIRSFFSGGWTFDLWPFGLSTSSPSNHMHVTNNFLKGALSDEDYKALLLHINAYVEKIVEEKSSTTSAQINHLSNDMTVLVANTVKENLVNIEFNPKEEDYERIGIIVANKLKEQHSGLTESQNVKFSQKNLEEISRIVKQTVSTEDLNVHPQFDIDEMLFKVISSSKLIDLIDQKISNHPDKTLLLEQSVLIAKLTTEIASIKSRLDLSWDKGNQLELALDFLKAQQENLENQLAAFKISNQEAYAQILLDIDGKLSLARSQQVSAIDERVRLVLLEIFGMSAKDGQKLTDVDLKSWITNVFVAKDYLDAKLKELDSKFGKEVLEKNDQLGGVLLKEISEKIRQEMIILLDTKGSAIVVDGGGLDGVLHEDDVQKIVRDALAIYDADKTGLVDYALESAGGEILSTRCTESYQTKTAQISIFGIPLWYHSNTPRTAISPAVQPGQCWAFQAFPGFLVLRLNSAIFVSGFTIEHIPKSLSPNGRIDSAPRLFSVWGLESEKDPEPVKFGDYEFLETGTSLQYFRVKNAEVVGPYQIVELRIESNHGNTDYTCLYRFRVHGKPPST